MQTEANKSYNNKSETQRKSNQISTINVVSFKKQKKTNINSNVSPFHMSYAFNWRTNSCILKLDCLNVTVGFVCVSVVQLHLYIYICVLRTLPVCPSACFQDTKAKKCQYECPTITWVSDFLFNCKEINFKSRQTKSFFLFFVFFDIKWKQIAAAFYAKSVSVCCQ